jgi:hypothetical protein
MPGRGSYGPAGKWIHDRAHRIMEESPDTPKSMAYAIATQQGHKVGKSPKKFRTSEGVATAKAKFRLPRKEYRKTAGALKTLKTVAKEDLPYIAIPASVAGGVITASLWPKKKKRSKEKTAALTGFFDELEKMAAIPAAAKFLAGVLLGSALWGSLDEEKKERIKDKAQELTGRRSMPPIIIMQGQQANRAVQELAKADPSGEDVHQQLGYLRDILPPELRKESALGMDLRTKGEAGISRPPEPPEGAKSLSFQRLNKSQKIGKIEAVKPPKPNIRAVATKV